MQASAAVRQAPAPRQAPAQAAVPRRVLAQPGAAAARSAQARTARTGSGASPAPSRSPRQRLAAGERDVPASGLGDAAAARSDAFPGAASSGGPQSAPGNTAAATTTSTAGQPQPPSGPEVVELKGKPMFEPSLSLAREIWERTLPVARLPSSSAATVPRSSWTYVNVRFGQLASGLIPVYWTDTGFETPPPEQYSVGWGIEMSHPAFRPVHIRGLSATPTLWINIKNSIVWGEAGWKAPPGQVKFESSGEKAHVPWQLLLGGLAGFTDVTPLLDLLTNTLRDGKLTFDLPSLTIEQGAFSGTGRLNITDEQYEFEGELDVPVSGLPETANVPLTLTPHGVIGHQTWRFERSLRGEDGPRISGEVTATLGHGSIDVRGTATYTSVHPRINGRVEIIVDSMDAVRKLVHDRLGNDVHISIEPAAPDEDIGITGFGLLDFTLSDWMTGNAEVIVHPEGWVTTRGEIMPTEVVPLFRKREKAGPIKGAGGKFDYPLDLPVIGPVTVSGQAQLYAYGWFGPGTLHDIRIAGLLSNHPGIINQFHLAGKISAPAAVGLHLGVFKPSASDAKTSDDSDTETSDNTDTDAEIGEASIEVAALPLKATLSAHGQVELLMRVELTTAVGKRESKQHPAEFYLRGELEASAKLVLALQLSITGDLVLWSGKQKLVDTTWTLGTPGGRLGFEYVLGDSDKGRITASFSKVHFDPSKFAADVARGAALEQKADYKGEEEVEPDKPKSTAEDKGVAHPLTPAAPGAALGKELTTTFTMSGEGHTLWLELIDPPDLLMASPSPRPEPLLERIGRAKTKTRAQAGLVAEERAARLSDLDKIEEQALLVLRAAQNIGVESSRLSPSVPGFEDLAWRMARYGTRYQTTDLAASRTDPVAFMDAEVREARTTYAPVLNQRPILSQELAALQTTVTNANPISRALEAKVRAMRARLAQLQQIDAISQAPRNARIIEVSPRARAANYYLTNASEVPHGRVVLEFPDGSRIWRDPDGDIRHEATLGGSIGRAGMERLKYTATKHGNLPAGPGYERAHSLGQGTGFESPYGIFYAPRAVNQTLQNNGIEKYMRSLADIAAPGETFRVLTKTKAHADSLRLARIDYTILRVTGSHAVRVATYFIEVTSSSDRPLVTANPIQFTAAGQDVRRRVRPPDVLTGWFWHKY
jgi:Bacterial toxin 4